MKFPDKVDAVHRISALVGLLAALSLSGCAGGEINTALSSVTGQDAEPNVVEASGFIEAEEVSVVSEVEGRVADVLADEADAVEAGDLIVVLDDALLQADRLQAQAAVNTAQADLEELLADPNQEEVDAAQAAVDRAEAAVTGARNESGTAWSTVSNPVEIDVQIAATEVEASQIQQQLDDLQGQLRDLEYELNLVESEDDPDDYDYDRVKLMRISREELVAKIAEQQARLDGTHQKLDMLHAERDNPIALIATARNEQFQIPVAEAQLALAQAQYDSVVADPMAEQVRIYEGQVALAEAQLALIDAQLDQLELTAPIAGTVMTRSIEPGETATAGVPLLTIADLTSLKLVVYISETQIGHVQLDMPVDIAVDSYPGRTFEGTVTKIGREAEFTPRNVQTEEERVNLVFEVEITIDNADGRLKPGMPADATFDD